MRRHVLIAVVSVVVFSVLGCGKEEQPGRPTVRVHDTAANDDVVIEAASFTGPIEPPMEVEADNAAVGLKSGEKCVRILEGKGKPGLNPDGRTFPDRWGAALYKFNVPQPGKYRLWVRAYWDDGCGNSLKVSMNKGQSLMLGEDGTYKRWHWVSAPTIYDLPAGDSSLEVLNSEDGVRFSRFLLTRDLDMVPQEGG
jgi:hypothetical protein